jgi:hypothetical protein
MASRSLRSTTTGQRIAAEEQQSSSKRARLTKKAPAAGTVGQRPEGATDEDAVMPEAVIAPVPTNGATVDSSMQEQMEVLAQIVRKQAQELQQLRASPAHSPQPSPQASPPPSPHQMDSPAPATAAAAEEPQSRFARKEPRAQDLREYDGASGAKLDEWLDELGSAVELYELSDREAVRFAASRLREAARQWWNALGIKGKAALSSVATLSEAMRLRFQPVTAAHTAREQLDKLAQGSRPVNDYVSDFQRLRARLPGMAEDDALHAFTRGLRRDIAVELRKQRVKLLADAIELAAHVGSISAAAAVPSGGARSTANQMDVDDGEGASLDDRISKAVLNAMQAQGSMSGLGAKTQARRGYTNERRGGGRGGARGGRGGRGGFAITIPGVPAAVVEQRRAAGQCFRCGSNEHRGLECPSVPSASQPSN